VTYPSVEKNVLVTGCSSGIGRAAADALRACGWTVIPTARRVEDLDALRRAGYDPIALEMGDAASVDAAAAETLRRFKDRPGAVVNNAGYGQPGAVEDLTREALRKQFEANVFGLQQLTNRLMPAFRAAGAGRIVNVSSVLGRISLPFTGAYCASKFALEALSDALRVETRGSGIAVSIIEPGPIRTRFGDNAAGAGMAHLAPAAESSVFAAHYREQLAMRTEGRDRETPFTLPPESVARVIVHALESPRPRRRYPVTVVAWGGLILARLMPAAGIDLIMARRQRPAAAASHTDRP
jgi:NAD(P)-dependent dehydrogenase (short-subunit alcohol dehydrogenase family)